MCLLIRINEILSLVIELNSTPSPSSINEFEALVYSDFEVKHFVV